MSTATTAPRLSLISAETASKPIKDALALLPVINVFCALANVKSLYPYFINYLEGKNAFAMTQHHSYHLQTQSTADDGTRNKAIQTRDEDSVSASGQLSLSTLLW